MHPRSPIHVDRLSTYIFRLLGGQEGHQRGDIFGGLGTAQRSDRFHAGIKDFKRALKGDRLSCTTYVANAFRLILHAVAYLLLDALRERVVALEPSKPRPQFDTLRLVLLKVGAHVTQSVRRIRVALPRSFPQARLFTELCAAIGQLPDWSCGAPNPAV